MDGRFFGLLALRNTINDGGQARADENRTFGAIRVGIQMCTSTCHLAGTTETSNLR